jgi:lysophospholipase L1-like esterase
VEEVCVVLAHTIDCLLAKNTTLRITFTVSPYRYKKYGWHRSQLSKAALLLAIDEMQRRYPEHVDYFPSYEMMMDELRDYRYYAPDGLHPSPEAVDIIWNRLCE